MPVNRIVDFTQGARVVEEPALLQRKPKFNWNPFSYLWTGWEHFAYFFVPINGCQFCWALRMFIVGIFIGAYLVHLFPWIRLW